MDRVFGVEWIKEFDKQTAAKANGEYWLLLVDGRLGDSGLEVPGVPWGLSIDRVALLFVSHRFLFIS